MTIANPWFPGHMRRALREIKARINESDVIIEVIDARAPRTTSHPELHELCRNKLHLTVLNKSDLADPDVTRQWRAALGVGALSISSRAKGAENPRRLPAVCERLICERKAVSVAHGVIIGIPNVGKSTIINSITQRRKLVVRNEPGVTRHQQAIRVAPRLYLWDTPGVLSPNVRVADDIGRLALVGAIPLTAVDPEDAVSLLIKYLLAYYPGRIDEQYKTDARDVDALLEVIGIRRGHLTGGGRHDRRRASISVLQDFTSGRLGRISLERPAMPSLQDVADEYRGDK